MVKIRLARVGRKNDPSYRIVVQDVRKAPTAKAIEIIGSYSPKLKQKQIKKDRAEYWLGVGAQPTGTVHNLFVTEGIIKGEKVNVFHGSEVEAAEEEASEADAPVVEEAVADAPADEKTEEAAPAEEKPAQQPKEEVKEEASATEEKKEETPAEKKEDEKKEEKAEEKKEE